MIKKKSTEEKLTIVLAILVVVGYVAINLFKEYKRVPGRGICKTINGVEDIKYVISRKPFVVCAEGQTCNVHYRRTAQKIFDNYGDEFVVMYCGEGKEEMPSYK